MRGSSAAYVEVCVDFCRHLLLEFLISLLATRRSSRSELLLLRAQSPSSRAWKTAINWLGVFSRVWSGHSVQRRNRSTCCTTLLAGQCNVVQNILIHHSALVYGSTRRSARHHSEAPASAEQRRESRTAGAAAISRQLAATGAALVTSGAAHHLQTGRPDLQDTSDICAGISQSTHHDTK